MRKVGDVLAEKPVLEGVINFVFDNLKLLNRVHLLRHSQRLQRYRSTCVNEEMGLKVWE